MKTQNQSISTIWMATLAIIIVGLVVLYSAAYQNVRVPHSIFYEQLVFTGLGILVLLFFSYFNYQKLYDFAYVLYGVSVILLFLVLISGRHILGARRWIEFGAFNFQPSELAKLAVILSLARYFSQRKFKHSFRAYGLWQNMYREMIFPFLLTAVPMVLVLKQPDLGSSLLLLGIFAVMVFMSGLRYRYVALFFGTCAVVAPFMWHFLKPYQKERLLVFLNPNIDPLGAGYTIIQSKIAVGSGRIFGKGWLAGTQNQLSFLPERHTDFIFSVVGEEWGLIGTLFLAGCFFVLIHSALNIAQQTKDTFGFLLAMGIVAIFSLQVIINIGMVIGLCPVVGITLPFVSYGRSSFLVSVAMVGILLNLARRRAIF